MPEVAPLGRQPGMKGVPGEDVDPHRGEVAPGLGGLLLPVDHAPGAVELADPHPRRLAQGHREHGDRHVGAVRVVGRDHGPVVHLVDVVAAQDEDGVRAALVDLVEVVADRIRRAQVPAAGLGRHVGLQELDAQAARPVEAPRTSRADVIVERTRVVLREDEHVVDARVRAVGQAEVDEPELAAEGNGRLGADRRQDGEPLAGAARQHDREHVAHRHASDRFANRAVILLAQPTPRHPRAVGGRHGEGRCRRSLTPPAASRPGRYSASVSSQPRSRSRKRSAVRSSWIGVIATRLCSTALTSVPGIASPIGGEPPTQ